MSYHRMTRRRFSRRAGMVSHDCALALPSRVQRGWRIFWAPSSVRFEVA